MLSFSIERVLWWNYVIWWTHISQIVWLGPAACADEASGAAAKSRVSCPAKTPNAVIH